MKLSSILAGNEFRSEWRIPLLALFGPLSMVCPLKTSVKDIPVDNSNSMSFIKDMLFCGLVEPYKTRP